jgi:hypothetical protein
MGIVRSGGRAWASRSSGLRRWPAPLVAAGLSLSAATVAWAASGPTGNARAIAIARAEARAYTRIPAELYTETGLIGLNDQEGRTSYFAFKWGLTRLPRGWTWATEHGTVALHRGRVVWWRDELTPPPCTRVGICHQIPVEILAERSGAYWAFGDASRHTCFGRLRGTDPIVVGALLDRAVGQYRAPVLRAGTIRLTYTYPFGTGRSIRETDTLSARTHLGRSGRMVITGGHTIRFSQSYPAKAPAKPRVNLCAG